MNRFKFSLIWRLAFLRVLSMSRRQKHPLWGSHWRLSALIECALHGHKQMLLNITWLWVLALCSSYLLLHNKPSPIAVTKNTIYLTLSCVDQEDRKSAAGTWSVFHRASPGAHRAEGFAFSVASSLLSLAPWPLSLHTVSHLLQPFHIALASHSIMVSMCPISQVVARFQETWNRSCQVIGILCPELA